MSFVAIGAIELTCDEGRSLKGTALVKSSDHIT